MSCAGVFALIDYQFSRIGEMIFSQRSLCPLTSLLPNAHSLLRLVAATHDHISVFVKRERIAGTYCCRLSQVPPAKTRADGTPNSAVFIARGALSVEYHPLPRSFYCIIDVVIVMIYR